MEKSPENWKKELTDFIDTLPLGYLGASQHSMSIRPREGSSKGGFCLNLQRFNKIAYNRASRGMDEEGSKRRSKLLYDTAENVASENGLELLNPWTGEILTPQHSTRWIAIGKRVVEDLERDVKSTFEAYQRIRDELAWQEKPVNEYFLVADFPFGN